MIVFRQKIFGLFDKFKENKELKNKIESSLPIEYGKLKSLVKDIKGTSPGKVYKIIYDYSLNILDLYINPKWYDKDTNSYCVGALLGSISMYYGAETYLYYSIDSKKFYIMYSYPENEKTSFKKIDSLKKGLSDYYSKEALNDIIPCLEGWKCSTPEIRSLFNDYFKTISNNIRIKL